jgi:hypothetical protein
MGDPIGLYEEAAGTPGAAYDFFSRFVLAMQGEGLMPPWWTYHRHWHELRAMAIDRRLVGGTDDPSIFFAVEVYDVRQKWGYETSKILRTLAYRISEALWDEEGRYRYGRVCEERGNPNNMPICNAFLRTGGNCKWGSFCMYQHPKEKIPVCRFFLQGRCKFGEACRFRHSTEQESPVPKNDFADDFQKLSIEHPIKSKRTKGGEYEKVMVTGDGFSKISLMDHMVQNAGTASILRDAVTLFLHAIGVDLTAISGKEKEQMKGRELLKKLSNEGLPIAQYLWGKVLLADHVFGEPGSPIKDAALKVWTEAARGGNALAMAGLGLMHRDAGAPLTAVHWWNKALQVAAIPEAAYNIGVEFGGKERRGHPIDFRKAAMYYAHAADLSLRFSSKEIEEDCCFLWSSDTILTLGPNTDDQAGYQKLAKHNLMVMEQYIANPERVPYPQTARSPCNVSENPSYDSVESCTGCGREKEQDEKKLLRCARCQSARYCNSLCQKGDWSRHKLSCRRPSSKTPDK